MKRADHDAAMVNTTVRLAPAAIEALDRIGAERERTRNYLIRKAVEEYLARNLIEATAEAP